MISISQVTCDLNCCVSFYLDYCLFQDHVTKKITGKGHESRGLYNFDHQVSKSTIVACSRVVSSLCPLSSWSSILLCSQFHNLSSLNCDSCQFAKFHRLSSSYRVGSSYRVDKQANSSFELVHYDIWGLCPVVSKVGFRYFVTFVDDHSCMTWLYFMKNRSELLSHFSNFHAEIRAKFGVCLKTLRSDNTGEYFSKALNSYLYTHAIIHRSSCADTQSQYGIVERKNRHFFETAQT